MGHLEYLHPRIPSEAKNEAWNKNCGNRNVNPILSDFTHKNPLFAVDILA